MTSPETWIIYKTETMSDRGWEDRKLTPSQSLTDILSEEWDWSGKDFPQIGSRFREYENLEDPGNGASHGKYGDWVVTKIHHFSSPDTEQRIIVCYCSYQPIEPNWEKLNRVKSLVAEAV
ncbi:hypothetical protein [Limnofasciculus baicalensis]|uniref:Uncharacterized protein n=1 Tax=Limnofasciculus baicalensis BBK-W-15 TaxID=2699891 RepID=A0AAE3GXM6_9CYAN|nr:hypothetical protein [Limnofasciculus baicalensis]MCP2731967.1 hypothetical protein [Limnofasciculus baicalensis BBK-W-15]